VRELEAPRSFYSEPKTRTVAGVGTRIVQGWDEEHMMMKNAVATAVHTALKRGRHETETIVRTVFERIGSR